MTDAETTPFVPGARVAIHNGWDNYTEGFVDKVHKSGRFTLRDRGNQQWRPSSNRFSSEPGIVRWYASQPGNSWSRESVILWDETTDKEIREAVDRTNRTRRIRALRDRIERLRANEITNEQLDAIEAALAAKASPEANP